jgi:ankyrin repeat protein
LSSLAHHIAFSCDDRRFRWAFCQLETLRRTPLQKIPLALRTLPKSLDETYERTLQGLDEEKWEYAHRIFQFLTVSARPLYVQEVAEVFSIQISEEATGIPEFNARWREKDPELAVLSTCSSLVAVVKVYGEQVVQFSHFSVQEFLTSNRLRDQSSTRLSQYHVLSRPAHTFFARACLSVLLQLNFRIHKNSIKGMFPLATYAAQHMVDHAQRGHLSSLIEDGMDRLFEDNSRFAAWIWVYNIDNPSGPHMDSNKPGIPETSSLYYASLCGFVDMVKLLVASHPEDVHTRGRDGATPLHAALRNGHSGVAQLLLQHKADANARDNQDETPLHVASRRGDITAIQSLITSGAEMNAKNRDNETPLSLASSTGSLEAVRLLLKHRADVDHKVTHKRTALHMAAEHGHYSVANLLLSNGADVDAKDRNDRTPLHVAADHGKVGVARLLLQRHAKVNAREVSQQTSLHMASSGGQLEVVRTLLDFKADVNAGDGEGRTALHLAAYNGHLRVAELLRARGATWDNRNNDGNTPLEVASGCHDTEIAQVLLHEANAEGQSIDSASRLGDKTAVDFPIASGAKMNHELTHELSALHMAAEHSHDNVVDSLLNHGPKVDAKDRNDRTPLHVAADRGEVGVASLLLRRRGDVHAREVSQQTPLHMPSSGGQLGAVVDVPQRGAVKFNQVGSVNNIF